VNADTRLIAGRYRLDQRIGTGAMGVVWRAHDERLDRTVAIKELLMQPSLGQAQAQTARARAMREGRIAARLQHPNAICVYDVALDRGSGAGDQTVPWLVMEYLPSRSLATVLDEQGMLAPHEAAKIGQQVAAALAAAHEAGIVHRDVKPGNVLLGHDGIVKITDFGISRASWDATVTCAGVLAGTPAYFAPEVVRGEQPGPASDVFALGSTLYAAVEGAPPFGLDDNTLALLRTVAECRVRPPQRAGPLSTVLMQLLADDPAARPSMSETVTALGAAAAHGASSHVQPPMTAPTRTAAPTSPPPTAVDLRAARAPDTPVWPKTATNRIRWWQRPALLFGAASCLVLVAVVLAVVSNIATTGRGQLTGARSTAPSTPGANLSPTPVQQLPTQPEQPGPAQLEQAVRTYYNLLPDDTNEAWQFLGVAERAKARGLAGYIRFWDGIDEVSIRGPVAVQGNTVLVSLVFEPANRKRTLERYRLTMGSSPDGEILIESAARIGGVALTAAEPR
jgi:eukaryotic-like serine/threonine-protein kinase